MNKQIYSREMFARRSRAISLFSVALLCFTGLRSSSQNKTLTTEQQASIDRYVTAEMKRQRVPGVEVGVYRDGKAVLEKGYGLANLEWDVAVTPDTLFQSGSVGKQFLATAVMMLVEQGKVKLEDSITVYFPEAPSTWKPIKVKNLLSHTSGLAEYESEERIKPGGDFDLRLDFTEDELATKIEKLPIEFAPGDKWDYRNTNYVLLGILVHRVTGQFYGDFMRDHIFKPLGMVSTRIISDKDIVAKRAAGYRIVAGELKNQDFVSPTFNSTGDGTLYFDVVDLERWDRALYGTDLLKKESLDVMWTPFVLNDGKANSANYGFAWAMNKVAGHKVIEHTGAWQGFTTVISRYVEDKLTVVVLMNLDSGHAKPVQIERVVAGLVEPKLMPEKLAMIADDEPALREAVKAMMTEALAGKDVGRFYAASAGYKLEAGDAADLRSDLPASWESLPMVLVRRQDRGPAGLGSQFRLGALNDARSVIVVMDASGKITSFVVRPDADNR